MQEFNFPHKIILRLHCSDYYSASALDQMMLDMSSSSTIVECYCGQNSCPQCNLLLKMAGDGSDG